MGMMRDVGWSSDTAKVLARMLEDRGISLRMLADSLGGGHSHNYWHQRLKPGAGTKMSLEDIEAVCAHLGVDPRVILT